MEQDKKQAIENRLNGILPLVYIAGIAFEVSFTTLKLTQQTDRRNVIDLIGCRCCPDWVYEFEFNTQTGRFVELDKRPVAVPPDVVSVRLPPARLIDPIGFAMEKGLDTAAQLADYPLREYWLATLIPLSATDLQEQVRRNQIELEVQGR
jgi:hypothetical protein